MSLPAIAPRAPHERSAPLGVYLGLGSTALCFVLELVGIAGFHALAFVLLPAIVAILGVCVLISLDLPRSRSTTPSPAPRFLWTPRSNPFSWSQEVSR